MNSDQVKGCAAIIDGIVAQLSKRVRASAAHTIEEVSIHLSRSTFAGGPSAAEHEAIEALRNILDVSIEHEVGLLRERAKCLGHEITDSEIADMEARLHQAARTHANLTGGATSSGKPGGFVMLSAEEQAEAVAKYPDHTRNKALSLYATDKARGPQLSVVGN